jgi:hypothetical protein
MTEATTTTEAVKTAAADTTATDTTKAAETTTETAKAATTEAAKTADTAKTADDTKKADEAVKEFVADTTKTDAENDAARAEFDKANPPADDKKGGLPDDWREIAAGKDEATLKLLKRYGSISGVAKALKEANDTIRSGKVRSAMPDPKDEKAMAEWRKGEGIPPDATGYKLPEEVQKRLVDEDKPILSNFTDFAFKKNARPDVVEIASEWYVEMAEAAQAKQIDQDKSDKTEAEDTLRKDWAHGEYKANTTIAKRFAETIPGLGADILGLRAPDGRLAGSVPEFIAWLSDQGRDKYGDVVFTNGDSERKHTMRREEIEKIRDTDFKRYEDEGLDKELRGLIEKDLARGKR